jgi:chemotaxis protein MotB
MSRRRNRKEPLDNSDRWLLTYSDMITLLLAFFVVMYSMSRIDAQKFRAMSSALDGILRGGSSILDRPKADKNATGHGLLKLGNLRMIQQSIQSRFSKIEKNDEVMSEVTERGLVVHILESALFQPGSADLQSQALDVLDIIWNEIRDVPNHIRIEGHTDDRSISTPRYPSNWELSSARATSVVRHFIDNYGVRPEKISALGYGEYRPIRPNNTVENRANNRRVDVVVLTMELSMAEPSSQLYDLAANR